MKTIVEKMYARFVGSGFFFPSYHTEDPDEMKSPAYGIFCQTAYGGRNMPYATTRLGCIDEYVE